jgi:hypothetical protein
LPLERCERAPQELGVNKVLGVKYAERLRRSYKPG